MKKQIIIYTTLLIIFGSLITIISCSKEKAKDAPTVRTSEVTKITEYSAECGGIVTLEGDAPVFERGICWDTIPTPNEIDCPHVKYGEGFGEYAGYLFALHENTKYYVRAYAINNYGTGYGELKDFTTLKTNQQDPSVLYGNQSPMGEVGVKVESSQVEILGVSNCEATIVVLKNGVSSYSGSATIKNQLLKNVLSNIPGVTINGDQVTAKDFRFRLTDEGFEYLMEPGSGVIVKYASNIGDSYPISSTGKVRTVVAKTGLDDYAYGFLLLKVIQVEETPSYLLGASGIKKIRYIANHKFGLVGVNIFFDDGTNVIFPVYTSTSN